jgi:hypothetical protein
MAGTNKAEGRKGELRNRKTIPPLQLLPKSPKARSAERAIIKKVM